MSASSVVSNIFQCSTTLSQAFLRYTCTLTCISMPCSQKSPSDHL